MMKYNLNPAKVKGYSSKFTKKYGMIPNTPRYKHCLDIATYKAKMNNTELKIVNISQRPSQAGTASDQTTLPCITPSGIFFLVARGRPMLGLEKALLMGMDLGKLDYGIVSDKQPGP